MVCSSHAKSLSLAQDYLDCADVNLEARRIIKMQDCVLLHGILDFNLVPDPVAIEKRDADKWNDADPGAVIRKEGA